MVRFGVPGQNIDPLAYSDTRLAGVPTKSAPRDPTVNDRKFPIQTIWRNSITFRECILIGFISGDAIWACFTGVNGTLLTLTGDDAVVIDPNLAGNIDLQGTVVPTSTNGQPVFFDGDAALNLMECDVQLAGLVTPTPGDTLEVGLASFNDTQFTKDNTSGMISLVGGGIAIDSITGDDGVPVGPDGAGNLDFQGSVVPTSTNAKPVFFDGDAGSNLQECEVQLAGLVAPTPVDTDEVGLASFNSNDFTKDATSGMISLVGGPPGFVWVEVAINTQVAVNTGYIVNAGATITMTLPVNPVLGDKMCFIQKGAGTITIAQNAGQTIHTILGDTTTGITGQMDTVDQWSSFCLICVTANTDFALEQGSHGVLILT